MDIKTIIENNQQRLSEHYKRWKKNKAFYENKIFVSVREDLRLKDFENDEDIKNLLKFTVKANRIQVDVHKFIRTLKNLTPTIMAVPKTSSQSDIEKAEYTQRFIDAFFRKHGVYTSKHYKFALTQFIYGIAGYYIGYRKNAKNEIEYTVKVLSPERFIFDATIEDYEDQPYCVLIDFVPLEIAQKFYPDVGKTNKIEDTTVDMALFYEYYERGGKHIRYSEDYRVLFEEDNPHGDRLPIVYAPYFASLGTYVGYSPIDVARVYMSLMNLIFSITLYNSLMSGVYLLAPEGSLQEDVVMLGGSVIEYNTNFISQTALPRIEKVEGLPQSTLALYNLVNSFYEGVFPLYDIEAGEITQYASARSKELEYRIAEAMKVVNTQPMIDMYVELAKNMINDVQIDAFGYWSADRVINYLDDEDRANIMRVMRSKITDADIVVKIGDDIPLTKQDMYGLVIQQMAQRLSQNPNDFEAKKFFDELYRRYGLGYISSGRSRDENVAKYENELMKKIFKVKLSDEEIAMLMQQLSQGGIQDVVLDYTINKEFEKIMEYLKKAQPSIHDNHYLHLDIHYEIVKTPEFKELEEWKQFLILQHLDLHRQYAGGDFSMKDSTVQKVLQSILKNQQKQNTEEGGEIGIGTSDIGLGV